MLVTWFKALTAEKAMKASKSSRGRFLYSRIVLANTPATSHMCLFKFKLIKVNKCSSSSVVATFKLQQWHVAGGHCVSWHRYGVFITAQQVLLDSTAEKRLFEEINNLGR